MYTPSYLESIDISYNEIPIITQDITVGTSKVKYLNLSHNSIDEIRPGNIRFYKSQFIFIINYMYFSKVFLET